MCTSAQAEGHASWAEYRKTFISKDGRVIDYGQEHASTSESQGYGMLLAVINNDRRTFDSLWNWTRSNLQVRQDNLIAWLWGKRDNGSWEVKDYNNATDGDTIIAMSLLKAAERWGKDVYKKDAQRIVISMREKLAVQKKGKTFLLPGYFGFSNDGSITLNPSYIIPTAYSRFTEVDDKDFWQNVHRDGLELLRAECFGKTCLPADWVQLRGNGLELAEGRPARFGHDAIRTILHASWASEKLPTGVTIVIDNYKDKGSIPLWVDLKSGEVSKRNAQAGYYAIYGLAAKMLDDPRTSRRLFDEAEKNLKSEKDNYYSYSLYLLSHIKERL
jgi:endoglucanase